MDSNTLETLNELEDENFLKILMSILEGIENNLKPHETTIKINLEIKEQFLNNLRDLIMESSEGKTLNQQTVSYFLKQNLQEGPFSELENNKLDLLYKFLKKLNTEEIQNIQESHTLIGGNQLKSWNWNINVKSSFVLINVQSIQFVQIILQKQTNLIYQWSLLYKKMKNKRIPKRQWNLIRVNQINLQVNLKKQNLK